MYQTIFKAGKYTPQGEFTNQHLLDIAQAYDPENIHEAPLVVGHNHLFTGEPRALAWVKSLRTSAGELQAEFTDVSPELERMIKSKEFKRCSVELGKVEFLNSDGTTNEKWYLFAVALTNMPAVGSLKPLEFKTDSKKFSPGKFIGERLSFSIPPGSINFSNNNQTKQIIMFAKLISVATKFGIDAGAATEESPELLITGIEAKFSSITAELSAAKSEIASLKEASSKFALQRADDLVASAIAAGKVKPADKDKFQTFAVENFDAAKAMFEAMPINPVLKPSNVPASPEASGKEPDTDAKFQYEGKPLTYTKFLELFTANPKFAARFTEEEISKLKESENK